MAGILGVVHADAEAAGPDDVLVRRPGSGDAACEAKASGTKPDQVGRAPEAVAGASGRRGDQEGGERESRESERLDATMQGGLHGSTMTAPRRLGQEAMVPSGRGLCSATVAPPHSAPRDR